MLFKMKKSWVDKGTPLIERDDDIVKVNERFRKVKRNETKMKDKVRRRHVQDFCGKTVILGTGNIREKIMSDWYLPARMKKSLLEVVGGEGNQVKVMISRRRFLQGGF